MNYSIVPILRSSGCLDFLIFPPLLWSCMCSALLRQQQDLKNKHECPNTITQQVVRLISTLILCCYRGHVDACCCQV